MSLKVLLVEDSDTDAALIERELRRSGAGIELRRAVDRPTCLAALEAGRPDVVISDHGLGQFEGRDVLRIIRALPEPPPFLLVTGSLDEETAVEYMKAGAADYILKDRVVRLASAVRTAVERDRDRREMQRAEEARREIEERLSLFVRATNDAIWDLDVSTGRLYVNEGFRQLFGGIATNEPLTLETWHQHILAPDRARVQQGLQSVLDSRASYWTDEYRMKRVDDSIGTVLDRAYIMRDTNGAAVRAIGAIMDVTDRERLQAQLLQAQKMEAVGRLAGGVAHDFNNILTGILISADLLLGNLPSGDAVRAELEEIRGAAERAADLTRQMLAFSRKQVMALKVVDLNEVVRNFGSMLQRLIGEDVRLHVIPGEGLGSVRADRSQLEQVLLNLAVNARDAMPKGGKLTIETANIELDEPYVREHSEVAPGPYVMFAVSDTGVGMDEATRERIFEPFFTTKEAGKGTGLGLSTVYGIVRQHGGHMWVYSEPGKGATFKVYLPRVDGVPDAAPIEPEETAETEGGETILLVEDDALVRMVTERALRRHGYTVLGAGNLDEALSAVHEAPSPIDLLVTDVMLPDASGPEVAERLADAGLKVPVLFLSGYSEEAVVRHGHLHEGTFFLGKPFTPRSLARKVREVLASRA